MRKAYGIFSDNATEISFVEQGSGIVAVTFDDGNGGKALVIINPHKTDLPYTLECEWNLIADGEKAGASTIARECGQVTSEAISIRVYVNDVLAKS